MNTNKREGKYKKKEISRNEREKRSERNETISFEKKGKEITENTTNNMKLQWTMQHHDLRKAHETDTMLRLPGQNAANKAS